jgi:uncharacterized protein YbbC (DUF1343 family)
VASALNLDVSEREKLRLARITGYNESLGAARRLSVRNGAVLNGIDILQKNNFNALRAAAARTRRIGLATNQTGMDAQGRRTIDVLAHVPGIELAAIFSPEHGIGGELDTPNIANSRDVGTGVPIYAIYGDTDAKRRPPQEILKTLDAVVYDVQDAGVRFYTYETTLGYMLEEAAKAGINVIVLDRPNPITGSFVQGPVSDPNQHTFVDYHPVPVRHGMTIGELARLFNAERHINARLTVVPIQGWLRGDWFDSTGLLWINPSPNLRSLTQAILYPGVALVEGTNLSVGRGTDKPFELVGAPWINGHDFAQYLNARGISGVRFVPVNFTPNASNYANQPCGGVNIILLDRNALDAPELGVELASALRKLYPAQYKVDRMIELLGNKAVFDAILAGEDPRRISADWQDQVQQFERLRKPYLLY